MGEGAVRMPAASSVGTARFMWLAHGGAAAAGAGLPGGSSPDSMPGGRRGDRAGGAENRSQ